MVSKEQLLINFQFNKEYFEQDYYVTQSNFDAYTFINTWPKWIKKFVNLYGEKYSGKSHLIEIFLNKTSYIKVKSSEFTNNTINKIKPKEAIIIEDFKNDIPEKLLYSLINIIEQENKYLIISSLKPINKYKFELKDLTSRINNCFFIKIKAPDDELIRALITKNLSDRQISIDKKLIEYIIKRINRSYNDIFLFIYRIDQISLQKRTPINLKIIKQALEII